MPLPERPQSKMNPQNTEARTQRQNYNNADDFTREEVHATMNGDQLEVKFDFLMLPDEYVDGMSSLSDERARELYVTQTVIPYLAHRRNKFALIAFSIAIPFALAMFYVGASVLEASTSTTILACAGIMSIPSSLYGVQIQRVSKELNTIKHLHAYLSDPFGYYEKVYLPNQQRGENAS